MKIYMCVLLVTIGSLQNTMSQEKKENIIVVVQPVIEKNVKNIVTILFKKHSKKDSLSIENTKNILFEKKPFSQSSPKKDSVVYSKYNYYFIATETGELKLPIIKVLFGDEMITSKPTSIKVVEKLPKATTDDIILKLSSNKNTYTLNDTINISLYEYSRFYRNEKNIFKKTKSSDVKLGAENGAITVKYQLNSDDISGIKNIDNYLIQNFEPINLDLDIFKNFSVIEKLNGKLYIKTLLFNMHLKAKEKGVFKINKSKFVYDIYKNEFEYSNSFKRDEKGKFSNKTTEKILITSKKLKIKIK